MSAVTTGRNRSAVLASNLCLLGALVFVILWPATGSGGLGIVALALLLLAASFAGMNASRRGKRARLVRPANACTGSCAGCSAICETPEAVK